MNGPQIPRRQFAVSAGATILAVTAGLYAGSRRSEAVDVGVSDLSIEKQTASAPDAPTAIELVIEGSYAVDANVVPDSVVVIPAAQVADSVMGYHEFETYRAEGFESQSVTGEFTIRVDLRELQALRDVFPTSAGETASTDIVVQLLVGVRSDGSQIGSAEARETFTLTLEHALESASVGFDAVGIVELDW